MRIGFSGTIEIDKRERERERENNVPTYLTSNFGETFT